MATGLELLNLNQPLTIVGCGSDTIQKDLELDKTITDEYIRNTAHELKQFLLDELTEEDKILLPHFVYGFVLRSRKWGQS